MSALPVGFVSTWPPARCGIATYSAELVEALDAELETPVAVLSEARAEILVSGAGASRGGSERVEVACWNRVRPQGNATAIERVVRQYELQVVHVQHEYGLWPNENALRDTLRACRAAGAKTVVTMHTVFPFGGFRRSGTLQMLGNTADVIIVHTREAQAAVLASGPKAAVHRVPHGTKLRNRGARERGLKRLNVPPALRNNADIVFALVFGFQGPSKNIVATVRAFAEGRARRQLRNCVLIIAGEIKDEFYSRAVNGVAMESGYMTAIYKRDDFFSGEKLDDIFATADFGILNNSGAQPMPLSASGQVHLYASYGVPLVCADVPIYSEAIRAGAAVSFALDGLPDSPSLSCVNAIAAAAGDARLRAELAAAAKDFAAATSWSVIAEKHASIYRGVIQDGA